MSRISAYEENPGSPRFETSQVKLQLTSNKSILEQLEINKRFRLDKQKKTKYVVLQFNGGEFRFYPNRPLTFGKTMANALRRDSAIIVGPDQLTGEIEPFLEIVSEYNILEGEPEVVKLAETACPICKEDQLTFPRLARHIMKAHPEYEDEDEPTPVSVRQVDKKSTARPTIELADGVDEV